MSKYFSFKANFPICDRNLPLKQTRFLTFNRPDFKQFTLLSERKIGTPLLPSQPFVLKITGLKFSETNFSFCENVYKHLMVQLSVTLNINNFKLLEAHSKCLRKISVGAVILYVQRQLRRCTAPDAKWRITAVISVRVAMSFDIKWIARRLR